MYLEKFTTVIAKFTPKVDSKYYKEALVHKNKTFRWLVVDTEHIKTVEGYKYITRFTPHDKGFETIGITYEYDLTNIKAEV